WPRRQTSPLLADGRTTTAASRLCQTVAPQLHLPGGVRLSVPPMNGAFCPLPKAGLRATRRIGGNMIGKSVGSIVSGKQIQELIAVPSTATVSEAVSRMREKAV